MPYIEHGFNNYLPRNDERPGFWWFSFLLSDPLTWEKMAIFTIRFYFRQWLSQRHKYEIHGPFTHYFLK